MDDCNPDCSRTPINKDDIRAEAGKMGKESSALDNKKKRENIKGSTAYIPGTWYMFSVIIDGLVICLLGTTTLKNTACQGGGARSMSLERLLTGRCSWKDSINRSLCSEKKKKRV